MVSGDANDGVDVKAWMKEGFPYINESALEGVKASDFAGTMAGLQNMLTEKLAQRVRALESRLEKLRVESDSALKQSFAERLSSPKSNTMGSAPDAWLHDVKDTRGRALIHRLAELARDADAVRVCVAVNAIIVSRARANRVCGGDVKKLAKQPWVASRKLGVVCNEIAGLVAKLFGRFITGRPSLAAQQLENSRDPWPLPVDPVIVPTSLNPTLAGVVTHFLGSQRGTRAAVGGGISQPSSALMPAALVAVPVKVEALSWAKAVMVKPSSGSTNGGGMPSGTDLLVFKPPRSASPVELAVATANPAKIAKGAWAKPLRSPATGPKKKSSVGTESHSPSPMLSPLMGSFNRKASPSLSPLAAPWTPSSLPTTSPLLSPLASPFTPSSTPPASFSVTAKRPPAAPLGPPALTTAGRGLKAKTMSGVKASSKATTSGKSLAAGTSGWSTVGAAKKRKSPMPRPNPNGQRFSIDELLALKPLNPNAAEFTPGWLLGLHTVDDYAMVGLIESEIEMEDATGEATASKVTMPSTVKTVAVKGRHGRFGVGGALSVC